MCATEQGETSHIDVWVQGLGARAACSYNGSLQWIAPVVQYLGKYIQVALELARGLGVFELVLAGLLQNCLPVVRPHARRLLQHIRRTSLQEGGSGNLRATRPSSPVQGPLPLGKYFVTSSFRRTSALSF